MFKVGDKKVFFKHEPEATGTIVSKLNGRTVETPFKGKTSVFVEVGDKIVDEAATFCSVRDRFTKAEGRKNALENLLSKGYPVEERTAFWQEYFKVVRTL